MFGKHSECCFVFLAADCHVIERTKTSINKSTCATESLVCLFAFLSGLPEVKFRFLCNCGAFEAFFHAHPSEIHRVLTFSISTNQCFQVSRIALNRGYLPECRRTLFNLLVEY